MIRTSVPKPIRRFQTRNGARQLQLHQGGLPRRQAIQPIHLPRIVALSFKLFALAADVIFPIDKPQLNVVGSADPKPESKDFGKQAWEASTRLYQEFIDLSKRGFSLYVEALTKAQVGQNSYFYK